LSDLLGIKVDLVTKGSLKRRVGQRILSEVVML
jgi:predicted nucleotidyltransferase